MTTVMLSKRIIATEIQKFSNISTALSVYKKSCYNKIDFKIKEDRPVKEAIAHFTAFNVGCLAVVDTNEMLVGVLS